MIETNTATLPEAAKEIASFSKAVLVEYVLTRLVWSAMPFDRELKCLRECKATLDLNFHSAAMDRLQEEMKQSEARVGRHFDLKAILRYRELSDLWDKHSRAYDRALNRRFGERAS